MFTIPRTNVIESDTGFSVEVLGRVGLLYREQGRTMKIDSEVLMGPKAMVVYTDSMTKWLPPFDGEPVDNSVRQRIVENLRSAFRFRGAEIEVL